jgi:hypothetical protein
MSFQDKSDGDSPAASMPQTKEGLGVRANIVDVRRVDRQMPAKVTPPGDTRGVGVGAP